jgi:aerobic carbon-monoxide dehydrogenase small subunit
MKVTLLLNHRKVVFNIKENEYLLDTLRNNHIFSVKKGCDNSTCGVCTVLVDNKPMMACTLLTIRMEDKEILTVDGILDEVNKISYYFGQEGADQCGFCNPGIALSIYAMKRELKTPTDMDIKNYVVGNLCRCSGYEAQFKAIKNYLGDPL